MSEQKKNDGQKPGTPIPGPSRAQYEAFRSGNLPIDQLQVLKIPPEARRREPVGTGTPIGNALSAVAVTILMAIVLGFLVGGDRLILALPPGLRPAAWAVIAVLAGFAGLWLLASVARAAFQRDEVRSRRV